MKKLQNLFVFILGAISLGCVSAWAQGSLTPPGLPGPTMKTLDQVQPRTPISTLPFQIKNPGSYYLTTNLVLAKGSTGISISADNVTIDLNGFTMSGSSNSAVAIVVDEQKSLSVKNGSIRNWTNAIDAA